MIGLRTMNLCGVPGVPAQFRINGGGIQETTVIANAAGQAAFELPTQHDPNHPNQTAVNVFYEAIGQHDVGAPGYQWYGQVQYIQDGNVDAWIVDPATLGYGPPPYNPQWQILTPQLQATGIPAGTRESLCTAPQTFQGLTVQTQQFGAGPLFDPLVGWLTGPTAAADRRAIYAAHAADKMITVSLSGAYNEAGQFYQNVPGRDFSQNLDELAALIQEIATVGGLYTDLRLAGDGEGAGPGYNDPVGMTYGHDWLMANLERIVTGLASVHQYIRWCPAYDAWFYGWTPDQVKAFGQKFRSILGSSAALCGEFTTGVCHCGNGEADYAPNGPLYLYDLFQSEYDMSNGGHNDTLWQIGARMLGPAYVRPADEPPPDDPDPPFFLVGGTDRGPFYTCGFEDWLYDWVRNNVSLQTVQNYRQYKRGVGYALVG